LDEQPKESDPNIEIYTKKLMVDLKQIRKHARFAWDISPEMAVHLSFRFRNLDQVKTTIQVKNFKLYYLILRYIVLKFTLYSF
jgi:hypothetical protein